MFISLIKIIRRCIWKTIGRDPRLEYYIDLVAPRLQKMGFAIAHIEHNTKSSCLEKKKGVKGSLLGDYLEFGCQDGRALIYAYKCAEKILPWMNFYAFDSFKGLPELEDIDANGPYHKGQFACDEKVFMKNLEMAEVDLKRIKCVPGWFDQTLTNELKKNMNLTVASIVFIDCNLYKSYITVLRFITDIIETGTVIIFDDWFSYKGDSLKGAQKACAEWLSENPHISLQDWQPFGAYGKMFIVNMG